MLQLGVWRIQGFNIFFFLGHHLGLCLPSGGRFGIQAVIAYTKRYYTDMPRPKQRKRPSALSEMRSLYNVEAAINRHLPDGAGGCCRPGAEALGL
ncbi:hypothetical protein D3C71_1887680 [compost metagenome]